MHDQRPVRKKCIVLISGLQSAVCSLWNKESTIFRQVVVNLPEASYVSSPHSSWKRINFWGECSRFKRWRSTLFRVSASITSPVPWKLTERTGWRRDLYTINGIQTLWSPIMHDNDASPMRDDKIWSKACAEQPEPQDFCGRDLMSPESSLGRDLMRSHGSLCQYIINVLVLCWTCMLFCFYTINKSVFNDWFNNSPQEKMPPEC